MFYGHISSFERMFLNRMHNLSPAACVQMRVAVDTDNSANNIKKKVFYFSCLLIMKCKAKLTERFS